MKTIILDKKTGLLAIDSVVIELTSVETFTSSDFYRMFSLTKVGQFYFSIDDVVWGGKEFILELRPAIFSFKPCVFFTSKDSDFFRTFTDWSKRADLEGLKKEEEILTSWVRAQLPSVCSNKITIPPYGTEWQFDWGNIIVQSNNHSFDCGIYIDWNN